MFSSMMPWIRMKNIFGPTSSEYICVYRDNNDSALDLQYSFSDCASAIVTSVIRVFHLMQKGLKPFLVCLGPDLHRLEVGQATRLSSDNQNTSLPRRITSSVSYARNNYKINRTRDHVDVSPLHHGGFRRRLSCSPMGSRLKIQYGFFFISMLSV